MLRFALLFLALLLSAAPASAQTVLRLNGWLPPTHPMMSLTVKPWAEEVGKVTQGRVRIEATASSMGPPPNQFDMVRDGVVDIVFTVHGYTPQRFPLMRVGELPFLSSLSEPLSVAMWRVTQKQFASKDEHAGVQVLAIWSSQPGRVWTTKKGLKSVKDWDGMKLAGGAAINLDISKAMGAVGIRAVGPQASEMVRRGVADGLFIDASSFTDFSLAGTIKHLLEFPRGIYAATFFLGMNKEKWNQISEADRAAITRISGETLSRNAGRNWDSEAGKARESVKTAGVEVTMADGAYLKEIEDKLRFLEDDWLKAAQSAGVDGRAVLAEIRSIVANYK